MWFIWFNIKFLFFTLLEVPNFLRLAVRACKWTHDGDIDKVPGGKEEFRRIIFRIARRAGVPPEEIAEAQKRFDAQ